MYGLWLNLSWAKHGGCLMVTNSNISQVGEQPIDDAGYGKSDVSSILMCLVLPAMVVCV